MIFAGATISGEFTLRNATTGGRSDADSTPIGKLVLSGVDLTDTVTIAHKELGVYQWSATAPGDLVRGDHLQVRMFSIVATIPDNWDVYDDWCDLSTADLIALLKEGFQAADITIVSPINGASVEIYGNVDYISSTMQLTFVDTAGTGFVVDPAVYITPELHVLINGLPVKIGTASFTVSSQPGATVVVSLTHDETAQMLIAVAASTFKASKTASATLWAIDSSGHRWALKNITSWSVVQTVW